MSNLEDKIMNVKELQRKYGNLVRKYKDFVNLNPIQTGGILPEAAQKALVEFGVGYAPYNLAQGVEIMEIPLVKGFVNEHLPKFLGADIARLTFGARDGIYTIMQAVTKPGETVIVDGNRHYTTIVAAEKAGLNIVEVPNSGRPEYKINVDDYEPLIKEHKPSMIFLTYPDGEYGNVPDAKKLGEIAKKYQLPYLLNGAYSIGRMPIYMNEIGADFIVGSGHKSMASIGPIGVLGMSERWKEIMLKKSKTYPKSELEFLGSALRGTPILTLMASFPYLVARVQHWSEEVEKARWFSEQLGVLGLVQVGEKPHNHDLMKFETDVFYQISKIHPKKRAFLYEELKNKGIRGLKHGKTKSIKLSTYSIPKEDLKKVVGVFEEIVDTY